MQPFKLLWQREDSGSEKTFSGRQQQWEIVKLFSVCPAQQAAWPKASRLPDCLFSKRTTLFRKGPRTSRMRPLWCIYFLWVISTSAILCTERKEQRGYSAARLGIFKGPVLRLVWMKRRRKGRHAAPTPAGTGSVRWGLGIHGEDLQGFYDWKLQGRGGASEAPWTI